MINSRNTEEYTMRILHIDSEAGWRGGQNQVKLLIDGLRSRNIICHFAGPAHGPLSQKLRGAVPTLDIKTKGIAQLKAAWQILQYVKRHNIDLIDCHSSGAHSIAFTASLMGLTTPIVIHRRVDYLPGQTLSRAKYFSSKITRYVAISNFIADVLREYGLGEQRISVVRSAVSEKVFSESQRETARKEIRTRWQLPEQAGLILNVAALTEQKNHAMLLQSLAELNALGKNFYCIICGEGHLGSDLQNMVSNLGLASRVKFAGHVQDIASYYLAADVFAISSRNEGLGTSLLDAALYNLPIVATEVGGIPEIVIHNVTGKLAPHDRADIFASNIMELIEDTQVRQRLAKAACENVKREFSVEKMISGNEDLYRSILGY